jgi:IPT/TIG domain
MRTFARVGISVSILVVAWQVAFTLPAQAAAAPRSSLVTMASGQPQVSGGPGRLIRLAPKRHVDIRTLPRPERGPGREAKPVLPAPTLVQPSPPSQPSRPVTTVRMARKAGRGGTATTPSGQVGGGTATAPQPGTSPEAAASSAVVEQLTSFPTLGNVDNNAPSDTQLAVGPDAIVQMVNVTGQIYDKAGNTVGSPFDLGAFFGFSNGQGTDPRVHYDAGSGRFYASYEGLPAGGDEVDVAVSDDANPVGDWTVYDIADNSSNVLQDQPKLGYSNDKVTLSWNNYDNTKNPAAYLGVVTAVINRGELDARGTITVTTFAQDSGKFQVVPATSLSSVNNQYALWHSEGSSDVHLVTITGVPGVSSVNQDDDSIGIGTADSPPAASQPSGGDPTITTNDGRMLSVAWQNNRLWGVFNVKCKLSDDTADRSCQRYVQITTSGDDGSLASNDNLSLKGGDLYFGSVALDDQDDLFSGFTASSSTMFATAVTIGVPGGNFPSPTFGDFYAAGDQAYACACGNNKDGSAKERWGDYSGTARDPSNPKDVWTVQQIGGLSTGGTPFGGPWGTAMDRVTLFPPTVTGVSPNHAPELSSACAPTVTITGTEFARSGTSVKFGTVAASSVNIVSAGSLTAVAPAQARGTVDVTVTTPDGTSATGSADEFTYDPDTTAPTTTASPAPAPLIGNDGWTNGPVTVSLSADDGICGSGVQNLSYSAAGAQSISLTTVAASSTSFSIVNEGVTTVTFYASDNAGNVESAKTLIVKIDNAAPRVVFGTPPSGSPYLLNQPVPANYSCIDRVDGLDGGVGVATCSGPVANGSNIITSPVGSYTFTVNTSDKLGNATSQSASYTVTYKICLQYDPTKAGSGRGYVFTIQICDNNNVNFSTLGIKLTATGVDGNPAKAKPLGNLNPGNVFLYGPGTAPGASYTYVLDTLGLSTGSHLLNFIVLGDPVAHTAPFILKK